MTKAGKIILGVAGVLFFLLLILVSFGVWMIRSAFQSEEVDQVKASAAFDDVRRQFAGVEPAFEFRDDRPSVRREPPAAAAAPPPQTVRILVWDPDESRMSRIALPFSLLRLSNDRIEFDGVELEVTDVERYGRTLLLDGDTPEGDRILVWTD
jgi:hypothetical protein